jgi:hypothetical protein
MNFTVLSWHQTDIVNGRKSEVQICSGHDMIKYATQTNEMHTFQIDALIRSIEFVYVAQFYHKARCKNTIKND